MKRLLRRGAALLVLLVAAWALIAWFDWLPRIDADQRAAVALMQAPPRADGGPHVDAFARVWLLTREVPEADWARLLALPAATLVERVQQYPERASGALIEHDNQPSLAMARSNSAPLRTAVAAAAPVLRQRDWLYQADGISWPLPAPEQDSFATAAVPDLGHLGRTLRQAAALAFVDGDVAGAQAQLCASAGFWRRLVASSDALVPRMASMRMAEFDLRLLMQMRATTGEAPPPCAVMQPARAEELDLCPVMRTEFQQRSRFMQALFEGGDWLQRAQTRLFFHAAHTEALEAQSLAHYCGRETASMAAAVARCSVLERVFNPGGCIIAPIAAPAYAVYAGRVDDYASMLREAAAVQSPRPTPTASGMASDVAAGARPQ